jgi:hypothetical protein
MINQDNQMNASYEIRCMRLVLWELEFRGPKSMEAGEATEPCSAVPYHAVFSPQSRFTLAYLSLPSGIQKTMENHHFS